MMKRKVSVIWVVVLALIAIAACAFAAVTYYRCEKQPEPQFPENELLRILDAGSDAEGVGFEVMRIGGGSVNLRLDLRWKNDSGKTIAYYAEIQSTENFCGFPPRAAPNQSDVSSHVYVGFIKIRQKAGGNLCRQQKLYNIIII